MLGGSHSCDPLPELQEHSGTIPWCRILSFSQLCAALMIHIVVANLTWNVFIVRTQSMFTSLVNREGDFLLSCRVFAPSRRVDSRLYHQVQYSLPTSHSRGIPASPLSPIYFFLKCLCCFVNVHRRAMAQGSLCERAVIKFALLLCKGFPSDWTQSVIYAAVISV